MERPFLTDRTAGKDLKNKCKGTGRKDGADFPETERVAALSAFRSMITVAHDKTILKGTTFSTERTH